MSSPQPAYHTVQRIPPFFFNLSLVPPFHRTPKHFVNLDCGNLRWRLPLPCRKHISPVTTHLEFPSVLFELLVRLCDAMAVLFDLPISTHHPATPRLRWDFLPARKKAWKKNNNPKRFGHNFEKLKVDNVLECFHGYFFGRWLDLFRFTSMVSCGSNKRILNWTPMDYNVFKKSVIYFAY